MTEIQEAKRSAAWMAFFFIAAIPGTFSAVLMWYYEGTDGILFGFIVSITLGCIVASIVNLLNWRDVLKVMFDEDDEPPDLPTGRPRREQPRTITINSAHTERARLVVPGDEPGRVFIGEYGLLRSQWKKLTVALRDNPVEAYRWSRGVLQDTGIFPGLTVGTRYNDVTKSFEDAQMLNVHRDSAGKILRAHVTNRGIEALHAAAGMGVVTR